MIFPKRAASMTEGTSAANYLKVLDYDKPTAGAKPRYKINLVVHENGELVSKIFEFGPRIYDVLATISVEMDITKTKIKISRKGQKKNTQWTIIPLGPVDEKALKKIAAVELNKLSVPGANAQTAGAFDSELEVEAGDDTEIPF